MISFANPSSPGQSVEFEAVTNGYFPSGTVTFSVGTTVLCSAAPVMTYSSTGIADCVTSGFTQGMHQVAASYSGDAANEPSDGCVMQSVGSDSIFGGWFDCWVAP